MQFFVSIIVRIVFCIIEIEHDILTEQKINIKLYDSETKRQSEEWKEIGEPRSKKALKNCSKIRDHVHCLFF